LVMEGKKIGKRCLSISVRAGGVKGSQPQGIAPGSSERAFTLVELLVVISIISVLMAILMPALNGVRRQAAALTGMRNQREVANAVNLFAADHGDLYPPSVATVGMSDDWSWYDPIQLTGKHKRSPQVHRSMSAYLRDYIPDARTVFCPSAPKQYKYLQQSWDAGDNWNNPDNDMPLDPVDGTYCFYWNYIGYLGKPRELFRGPRGPASGGQHSQLLVSDYFGYGHWTRPDFFASCEKLPGGDIIEETWLSSALWSAAGNPDAGMPQVRLRAAFTDGHVESYYPTEVSAMRVSLYRDGMPPYPDGAGSRGIFYIPRSAVR
jgi:prepilin-type N-terminal cleavage/methylation domain-containing protein